MVNRRDFLTGTAVALACAPRSALADNRWEITRASAAAVDRGLAWLASNQGVVGNWGSNDLGLVSLGALAFLSAGHAPKRSRQYGDNVARALNFVLSNVKPSGLINIAAPQADMYNHGLSLFVLSQAYGVHDDRRMGQVLDKGLKLITSVQCGDGGWKYRAAKGPNGNDLSLAVMQAKALRAAMDMGLEVPPEVVAKSIAYVRRRYQGGGPNSVGAFTYSGGSGRIKPGVEAVAMAAAGAVCLQEFGEYDDYRIANSLDLVAERLRRDLKTVKGKIPINAYAMLYVAQALYQVGGDRWKKIYPLVRDAIVSTQASNGSWRGGYREGRPGLLFGTAVGVFALSIPNRYLPILQRGRRKETPAR